MPDLKISQLTEDTAISSGDLLATVESPGGTPVTKKVTVDTLSNYVLRNYMSYQLLNNGGFLVWQRATTFTFNDDTYGPDRWNLLTETNGAWICAQDVDVPANSGFLYSAKFSNQTQNNQCALVQFIENKDAVRFQGKTVSLSFYAKTNGTEIGNLRAAILSWTGTADAPTSDVMGTWASDGTNPTWAANFTAENTAANNALTSSWQRFTIEGIVLDTASIANLAVVIWVDDGTIATNDDFYITGVMVNEGSKSIPWMTRSYNEELHDCQRYCFVPDAYNNTTYIGLGMAYATTGASIFLNFPCPMRVAPTLVATAADWQLFDPSTGAVDVNAISIDAGASNKNSVFLTVGVASGLTSTRNYYIRADASAPRTMIFESEL